MDSAEGSRFRDFGGGIAAFSPDVAMAGAAMLIVDSFSLFRGDGVVSNMS